MSETRNVLMLKNERSITETTHGSNGLVIMNTSI